MLSRALRLPRLARPGAGLRYQSTKTFEPNAKLQKWLVDLPSLKLVEEDHTSLSAVQSLVSTVEFEENGAAEKWKKGDTLPPGWSLLFLPCSLATTSSLTPGDGTERSPYHSPPGSLLEERMWAGGSFSFPSPTGLKVGEDVECEITTPSVKDRVGKDGRRGWYVEQRRELRSAGEKGKPKVVETRVHLYRPTMEYATASSPAESPSPKSAPKPAVKKAADWSYPFHPTDIHLFRFSSITFNSHRIHWDRRYCREVEKRPDLVVHGPFTALMLLTRFHHALSALSPNLRVADFSYRNTAALSVDTRIEFKGRWKDQEKGECELWVEDGEGVVYMMGEGKATAK